MLIRHQLHHLAQVGQMLGAAIQPPISAWRYLQVRNILLILTDFLEKIESTRISPSNLSVKLRTQMSEIDRSMQESSARHQAPGLLSMGRSLLLGLPDKDGVENNTQINVHSCLIKNSQFEWDSCANDLTGTPRWLAITLSKYHTTNATDLLA